MSATLDVRFVGPRGNRRLWLLHTPAVPSGAVLYVHPFAEEMNKSRRMAALQARAFAARGLAVLQVDLAGCGDSERDLEDIAWDDWLADVDAARAWLADRFATSPVLWGLRAGALVVAHWVAAREQASTLLLWQPVVSGRQHLTQFLRTRAMAEALGGQGGDGVKALRAALARGEAQEVAGYVLGPRLAEGLDAAELRPPPAGSRVWWLETGTEPECTLSPVAQAQAARWREAGVAVEQDAVPGPPFWQTVEIAEAPRLVERTLALVDAERTA